VGKTYRIGCTTLVVNAGDTIQTAELAAVQCVIDTHAPARFEFNGKWYAVTLDAVLDAVEEQSE